MHRPVPVRARRTTTIAAALAVAGLVLAACGDDESPDTATATSGPDGSRAAGASTSGPEGTAPLTTGGGPDTTGGSGAGGPADREAWIAAGASSLGEEDGEFAECMATAVVDGFGHEELAATGVTPEEFWSSGDLSALDLERPDHDQLTEDMSECGDLVEFLVSTSQAESDDADCVREFFTNDQVAEVFAAGISGVEISDELQAAQAEMVACTEAVAATTTTG